MMSPMTPPGWIVLSVRIYDALLVLYPAEFRREYRSLMVQVFRDMTRERYRTEGLMGAVFWWSATLLDLTLTVIEQRRKVRLEMSKSTFVQLAATFLVLGGALSGLAAFSQLQPDDHYSYYGIYQLLMWLYAPGYLLLGLGCVGLGLREDQASGTAARWLLIGVGIGVLGMAVGVVATSLNDDLWNLWMGATIIHVIALTVFGLVHLRRPTLPIFRALPLMMASGWLFIWSGLPERLFQSMPQVGANALIFLLFLGVGLGWLGIGLAVQRQRRDTALATA